MTLVWILLALFALALSLQMIWASIVVYRRMTIPVRPSYTPLDLDESPIELPPTYRQDTAAMEALGFRFVANLQKASGPNGVETILTLFQLDGERTIGVVSHIVGLATTFRYAEFSTDFDDGTGTNMSNVAAPGIFPPRPDHPFHSVPQLGRVSDLYQVHRELVRRAAKTPSPDAPQPGQEVEDLLQSMAEDLEFRVGQGYLRLDPGNQVYRPTAKGAALMAWKQIWPVLPIRQRLKLRRGRRLLDDLGLAVA